MDSHDHGTDENETDENETENDTDSAYAEPYADQPDRDPSQKRNSESEDPARRAGKGSTDERRA